MDFENNISFCHNCRICFTIHEEMISISTLKESATEFNLLFQYFNIEVMTDVRYPNQICNVCFDKLRNIILFKERCESTANYLKDILEDSHTENGTYEIEILSDEFLSDEPEKENEKDEEIINVDIKIGKSDEKTEWVIKEDTEIETQKNSKKTKNYKCQYCDKIFHTNYAVLRHEATHLRKPFKCDQCSKKFKNNDLLLQHLRIHLGQKPFDCTECSRSFASLGSLRIHKQNLHSKPHQKIVCKECGIAVKNIFAHRKYKHSAHEFQCKYCEKKFPIKSLLTNHVNEFHENLKKSFKILCPLCGQVFRTAYHLTHHNRIRHSDERNYSCKYCEKRFKTSTILAKHTQTHLNIRRFKCTYCERGFNDKQILINHIRTHTGERPFKCNICTKDFAQKATLRTHVKLVHGRKLNV